LAWVINKIHCGHTAVRPSKDAIEYNRNLTLPQFPLLLKVWEDSAVVISNLLHDSIIKRGTIITSIDGVSTKNIVDSICELIGSDGYSNSFKYQVMSFNFPGFYRNAYGLDSQHLVTYIDSTGQEQKMVLKNYL